MKKIIALFVTSICCIVSGYAEDIVIKAPGFFSEPFRDSQPLFPDSIVISSDVEELNIPDIGIFCRLSEYNSFPKLRKITFGNVDYLPSFLLDSLPNLEEVVFNGMIGHFDSTIASNCPKLKSIIFRGPISTTGTDLIYNLPNLEKVVFESVVVLCGFDYNERAICPKLHKITNNGAFLKIYDDSLTHTATNEQLKSSPHLIADMERIARWQCEVLRAKNSGIMRKFQFNAASILQPILVKVGSNEANNLKEAKDYAWNYCGDDVKSKLRILKESPAYAPDSSMTNIKFKYATPDDSLLTLSRERFNLDSIAGTGNDISRIKNLLYWVHNNITHDGSNGLAPGPRNLRNNYDSARLNGCGYNCRALAICLAEALLAEGIPARYLTCLPKAWDKDNDCHVICVAWSKSLNKWIWVDPTFAAYVTDENGVLLHPGEVRYRLQHDMPLVLNSDANWNNRFTQTKENYLDNYMAKNLYIIDANTFNQAEPEGKSAHPQGKFVTLVPQGITYPNSNFNTTDEEWFWQAPEE